MKISFVIPTKNNLEYLKIAINSIRDNCGYEHELVILDDSSVDDTKEYLNELVKTDYNIKTYFNTGDSVGIGILYNLGVMLSSCDVFTIFHADMVCTPGYVYNLTKHLRPGRVVCATRIEPPLHPAGGDKIIKDFGLYPQDLNINGLYEFVQEESTKNKHLTKECIFAPWLMYKSDFMDLGGHDESFPITYEDSDLFNRFVLAKYEFLQSRDAFVYHFTCRGHRWTKQVKVDDPTYRPLEDRAKRDFIRKWGSFVKVTQDNYPLVPHKYNITYVIEKAFFDILAFIEPYARRVYVDNPLLIEEYINRYQHLTLTDLSEKIKLKTDSDIIDDDVVITFRGDLFVNTDYNHTNMGLINDITEILSQEDDLDVSQTYGIGPLSVKIKVLQPQENNLIKNTNNKILQYLLTNKQGDL